MIRLTLSLLLLGMQVGLTSAAGLATGKHLQPIATLDVPRYMGAWYEIAKYPNRFQRQCAANTRADYRMLRSGRIQVVNRCDTLDGGVSEAIGTARQIGPSDSPRLKVRFAPAILSFLPMVWGDYWVIDLDPEYQMVAVSEPNREYLWVLARTPTVDAGAYRRLLARLSATGFDTDRLEVTTQHP